MLQFAEALYGLYVPEDGAEGQGLVEYALIIFLISIAVIAVMYTLQGKLKGVFQGISSSLG